jgi:hypothetical protein
MATPPDFTTGAVLTAAQMNGVGLWKVGETSFASNLATVDGCFSANYDNYLVVLSATTTGSPTTWDLIFRTGAGDYTASAYVWQNSGFTTAALYARQTATGTSAQVLQDTGGDIYSMNITINNPFSNSINTTYHHQGQLGGTVSVNGAGRVTNNTSFTGLKIRFNGSTSTGQIKIYGYRN